VIAETQPVICLVVVSVAENKFRLAVPFKTAIGGDVKDAVRPVDALNSIRVFGGWTFQIQMGPI
jgi:hypothetical protein